MRSEIPARVKSLRAVVVLGSLNTDFVLGVPHLPRPGETVAGGSLATHSGGKGANQAVAAAKLGAAVAMVGRVGDDSFGSGLRGSLADAGVDVGGVEADPAAASGAALILVDPQAENAIAIAPGANAQVGQADVDRALSLLSAGDLLVLQLEIPLAAVEHAARQAHERGARVLLNAAPAASLSDDLLRTVEVLIVNEDEAGSISGLAGEQAGRELRRRGAGAVITTRGSQGVVVEDERRIELRAHKVTAVDTTAAGDAFVGGLAAALAAGADLATAARLGSAVAAVAVTRPGAQSSLPDREELLRVTGLDWEAALAQAFTAAHSR
ncbi:MAG: ribokinase [Candidatus Dormibacter sp.]|uniref:ribokinase n=1 Tax=Candidatus Dormibacter sp. TaxID=2973982 RepID=UPI0026BF665A